MRNENITYKNIKDFTPEDTIYIQVAKDPQYPILFYCQFSKFEGGRVYGTIINSTVNESLHKGRTGEEVSAKPVKCCLYGKTARDNSATCKWFDSMGFACYEKLEAKRDIMPEKHDSYGLLQLSRRTSNASLPLFGSSIKHSNTISLKISKGELNRNLNYDSYYPYEEIIEIEMSESQFAQAITTFNTGSGTPVTIHHIGRNKMPVCPFVSKTEIFHEEFETKMREMSEDMGLTIKQAMEILNSSKAISKGEREILLKAINSFVMQVKSNMPFIAESFSEQMTQTVTEAKAEIEAFLHTRSKELGLPINNQDKPLSIE